MKKCERKLELLGEGILARGIDGSVMNYDGFWRSFRQFDWEDGKVGEQKIGEMMEKFQFSLFVFGWKMEKWRDKKIKFI